MSDSASNIPVILVTGGTSGLGLEIVRLFLDRGYYVIATGRKPLNIPGYEDKFKLYRIDFCNLKETSDVINTICDNHSVSFVVNNAGILSPPDYTITEDGNEYTFQVNFLSHLLINELIIRKLGKHRPIRIAAITSVVHKLAKSDLNYCRQEKDYSPLKAYSDSKFFLAIMGNHLTAKYKNLDLKCFIFNPGVFGSSIYRMQEGWFRFLYRIAAPFMRRPFRIAKILADLITDPASLSGVVYNAGKNNRILKEVNPFILNTFWRECYSILKPYMD